VGSDRFQRYIDRPRQRRPAGAPAELSRNDRGPSAVPGHGSVRVHGAPPSQFVFQTAGHSARTKGDLSRRLPISRLRLPEQKTCSRERGPDAGRDPVHGGCGAEDHAGSVSAPGNGSFSSSIEEMRVRVGLGQVERLGALHRIPTCPKRGRPLAISCRGTYTPNSFRSSSPWPQRWSTFTIPLPMLQAYSFDEELRLPSRDDDRFAGLLVERDPPLCRGLVAVRPITRPRLPVGPGRPPEAAPGDGPLPFLRCFRMNSKKNS
jgi:hypothetical protein